MILRLLKFLGPGFFRIGSRAKTIPPAVQPFKQDLMHGEKRLGDCLQRRVMLRKLHNPAGEARFRGPAHLEAEPPQNAPGAHLHVVELALHQLASFRGSVSIGQIGPLNEGAPRIF